MNNTYVSQILRTFPHALVSEHTRTVGSVSFDATEPTEILEALASGAPIRIEPYQVQRLTLRTITTQSFSRVNGTREQNK